MRKPSARAFTLVELLVVIGIIAVLISVLLPSLMTARRQAATVQCAANLKQICGALLTYASDYKGLFPPNGTIGGYWCDADRVGRILPGANNSQKQLQRGVVVCPSDNALRSYAMNIWASCRIDPNILAGGRGALWKQGATNSSRLILASEIWSSANSTGCPQMIGYKGDTPGHRFGAGGGISPLWYLAPVGYVNTELPYYRHRIGGTGAAITDPVGRVNLGYADGHVATKSNRDLVDSDTALSTMDSVWSPLDQQLNDQATAAAMR